MEAKELDSQIQLNQKEEIKMVKITIIGSKNAREKITQHLKEIIIEIESCYEDDAHDMTDIFLEEWNFER